ncbi:MAG: hypothetical protein CM15mP42_01340 [Methanobacteriota archaeon]|nr:MAG: hypothetical protein CM15mP42_01340 [Euryarchaeota archaeon]
MDVKIDSEGAFGSAIVTLEAGEKFVSEAGAMHRASPNMDINVESRRKKMKVYGVHLSLSESNVCR